MLCVAMLLYVLGSLISGCGETEKAKPNEPQDTVQKETTEETKNDHIKLESEYLTIQQADKVFKDIKETLESTYNGIKTLDNLSIEFTNEKVDGDKVSIDVNLNEYWTQFRKPEEHPLIIGMNKALSEVKTEKEKEVGQKMIEGHLLEMNPYYNKSVFSNMFLRMEFDKESKEKFKYNLYFLSEVAGIITAYPWKEYIDEHFKEDSEAKEKMGYEMMKKELSNS